MGFKGSLDSINLADIFQNLAMNQQSGTLRVSDRDRAKSIYFQRGEVRYLAYGGRKSILLGEMLTGRAIATREQVNAALSEQKSSGRLLGEIIVTLGICTRDDVEDLVRFQIEEEIYDLFSWERAEFEFTEGPPPEGLFDPEQQATELAIDTSRLIMEAARRIDEWERIREVIPSMSEVFVATASPEFLPEGSSLAAQRILTFLDGTRTIDAVVEDSYFSRFEVAANLVAMIEAGQARPATVAELGPAAALCAEQGRPDRAVELMERALAQGHDDPALRLQLAEACIALEQNEKAAIHLNVLGDTRRAQGDIEGAVAAYERITEVLPRGVAAHEKLARLRTEQNDNEAALRHYSNLVQALMEGGRLDEAAARCREGLKLDQECTDLRSALAKVLLSSGDKDGAIDEFGRLAEVFARAGQVRPAAEVFRRILQIDPRDRHAKRRLNEVLAGTGVKRESHALRYSLIGLGLALLALVVYLAIHEMAVLTKYEEAEKDSQALEEQERFGDAREVWRELQKEWSVWMDFEAIAEQKITAIAKAERFRRKLLEEARRKAEMLAESLYEEALADEKTYKVEPCLAKVEEVLASEVTTEDLKEKAGELRRRVEEREQAISEYLAWHKKVVSQADVGSLRQERRRALEIHALAPGHPRLKDLKLPLLIETDPTGAEVFVDGASHGPAPVVCRYPPGKTPVVRAKMSGYVLEEDIDALDRVRVEVRLRRAVAWRYKSGAAVLSLTEGPEGMVLVANQDGALAALDPARTGDDPETRNAAWAFRTREFIGARSGVTVSGDTVYFGTDQLYAFDLASRQTRWTAKFGEKEEGGIPGPPALGTVKLLSNQEFVFGTYDDPRQGGTVWAVNSRDGSLLWQVWPSETRAGTRCGPVFVVREAGPQREERLYVPFKDGRVYELDVVKGGTRNEWRLRASSSFVSSMVFEGGLAWLVSGDGLFGLDLMPPSMPPRTFDSGGAVTTDLTVVDGIGYFGDKRGRLHAVVLPAPKRVWSAFAGEGAAATAPAVGEKCVYFGTSKGWVYAVDRKKGTLVWKYAVPSGEEVSSVYLAGRFLLAGSRDGTVYAFDEEAAQ
jgi:outer membrane protein assembly factor BamB/tetratricopeptide (TPR) repeat protein